MIVKMTRYSFLLYHRDVPQFLERLREKGLVDITLSTLTPSDQMSAIIAQADRHAKVARELKSIKTASGVSSKHSSPAFATPHDAVEAYTAATAKIAECTSAIVRARAEMEQIKVWGDFDSKSLNNLRQIGITLRFFETTAKAFNSEWIDQYPIEVVQSDKNNVYFVVAQHVDQPLTIEINAQELPVPSASSKDKDNEIKLLEAQIAEAQSTIESVATMREAILNFSLEQYEKIDFQKVSASGTDAADGTLKVLEGWSPNQDRDTIEEFAKEQDVFYTVEDARSEQNPPIKLKNNFFARLYEPIGALYLLPNYNELDMTPFFAPFFMIFFGMCFGDAGYGLLFIAVILLAWRKIPAKFKSFAWLGLFLNISAVVFGTLTGNLFGIELVKVDALVKVSEYFLNPNDVFYLAIAIGGVQVLFGQILRIFNRSKRGGSFVYGLSSLGWVILFISLLIAGFDLGGDYFSMQSVAFLAVAGVAMFLILFFNSPGKNPFVNLGSGLYSFYEMGTGVVGDLISYVRLFAIGLAGTVIAQVFNELSRGLSGDIPVLSFLVMVIILLIGHGLNIFISFLGAIVHPIRLTFVEFYKNAEFEGGGRSFTPFKRKINNK